MLAQLSLALMIFNHDNHNTEPLDTIKTFNLEMPPLVGQLYQPATRSELYQELVEYQEEALKKQKQEQEERLKRQLQKEREQQEQLAPVFNPYNVREISNITEKEFYQLLKGTGLYDVGWVFSFCEERFGINGMFLLGLTALESGWGNSYRATNHNNLTGYNIVSNSSVYTFESRSESVIATARLLSKDYLSKEGRYFNGYSIKDINKKYCASSDWHLKIIDICNQLMSDLKTN